MVMLQPRLELGFSAHKTDTLTSYVIGASDQLIFTDIKYAPDFFR